MVEVFKTNVTDPKHAEMLSEQIRISFGEYEANFDLEDCDRILRVKSSNGIVQPEPIIELLNVFGFHAQILPDDYPLSIIQSIINKSICQ